MAASEPRQLEDVERRLARERQELEQDLETLEGAVARIGRHPAARLLLAGAVVLALALATRGVKRRWRRRTLAEPRRRASVQVGRWALVLER